MLQLPFTKHNQAPRYLKTSSDYAVKPVPTRQLENKEEKTCFF